MALRVCKGCTARYAVGAPCCPQCRGTDSYEEGTEPMPKITRHGGPTIAGTWGDDSPTPQPETAGADSPPKPAPAPDHDGDAPQAAEAEKPAATPKKRAAGRRPARPAKDAE